MSSSTGSETSPVADELTSLVVSLVLVTGAAAVVLAALGALPGYLTGTPRGVTTVATVQDGERVLARRVALPAYFPSTLRWPPSSIQLTRHSPAAIVLRFSGTDGRPDRLLVGEAFGRAGDIPRELAPEVVVLGSHPIAVRERDAVLTRLLTGEGRIYHQLSWHEDDRFVVIRYDGGLDDLLKMGGSLRRGR